MKGTTSARLFAPLLLGAALSMACSSNTNNNKAASPAATTASSAVASATRAPGAASPAASSAATVAVAPTGGSPAASSTAATAGGNVSVTPGVVAAEKALAGAAGAGSPVDQVTISKPVEIQFWHTQTGVNGEKINALIKDFQAKTPNVTVNAQYVGSYDQLFQKLQTAVAGSQTPDVAVAYENQVSDYNQANVIVPLEDYVKSQKYGLPKDDWADILQTYRYDNFYAGYGNKLLSFPFTKSVLMMYYNADKLKEAVVAVPQTWDEFQKAAKAVTKGDTKGYAIGVDTSLFVDMVYSRGGQVLSEDQKKWLFNNQQGVDSLALFQNMLKDGSAYQISKQYADQTDFGAGRAAFTLSSSSGLGFYQKEVSDNGKFNWSVALPPHGTGQEPSTVAYGANVSMFKSTPEKQLASWLFIKYFTSKEVNPDWSTATGYLPIRTSGLTDERVKAKVASVPSYQAALQAQQYGRFEPQVRQYQAIRNFISDAIVAALSDTSKSAKQVLDDAVKQSNDEMSH